VCEEKWLAAFSAIAALGVLCQHKTSSEKGNTKTHDSLFALKFRGKDLQIEIELFVILRKF
jgi:hypothetical protein